ncbi:MAG: L-ribulose-5-phosphate 4-epimerase AraD [Verrucomicrobiota bacterium]
MLLELKKAVCQANLDLVREGLVIQTWGNVSGVDREQGLIVIKPSGVPYSEMKPKHMVVVSLATGRALEGQLKPSSDTDTHLELYRAFPSIGWVVHTHSLNATAWAQTCLDVPALGTTHADYCYGAVPVTEIMRPSAIRKDYEANTGRMIARKIRRLRLQPGYRFQSMACPFIFVANHAPFAWGATPSAAVDNAIVLEAISKMALLTFLLDSPRRSLGDRRTGISQALLDKHYLRKHGQTAYYGQAKLNPSR